MYLFPIGDVSSSYSYGTLYGKTYTFFEPNDSADGKYLRNIQTLTTQDRLIDTYKRNDPFRQIDYSYKDILEREYVPIKKFARLVEGGLNSFYVVDLSCGEYVGSVASPYELTVDDSSYYSTLPSAGAYYGFAWNGTDFMIGHVTDYDATTVTLSRNYGVTTVANAMLYPIYEVFVQPGGLDNFKTTVFADDNHSPNHGWVREGSVTFVTKYPVRV